MSLGICCHYLTEETKPRSGKKVFVNQMNERVLQLGRLKSGSYTEEMITGTYINNVKNLATMLPKIRREHGVSLFRISSSLFPLADQVDKSLWQNSEVIRHLKTAGDFIKANGMRVSTHPGQFCVLSSDSDAVVEKAFTELSIHGWMFDAMGLDESPQYAINIHGGKSDRITRLIEQIKSLPPNVRNRLTLENDESAYNVVDLLNVHQETGTPLVFDSHHHTFNTGDLTMEEAFTASCQTWRNGIRPLQHLANTEPGQENGSFNERRKHSNMVHYIPECQLQALRDNTIDVEAEFKMKNIAIFKAAKDFNLPL